MRMKRYQLANVIAVLITCGERLEIDENPNWHTVATAAAELEKMHAGKPVDLAEVCTALRNTIQQVAAVDRTIALKIDIALTLVDALRLGFIKLDEHPAPIWIGIDLARGTDQTGRATFHA